MDNRDTLVVLTHSDVLTIKMALSSLETEVSQIGDTEGEKNLKRLYAERIKGIRDKIE